MWWIISSVKFRLALFYKADYNATLIVMFQNFHIQSQKLVSNLILSFDFILRLQCCVSSLFLYICIWRFVVRQLRPMYFAFNLPLVLSALLHPLLLFYSFRFSFVYSHVRFYTWLCYVRGSTQHFLSLATNFNEFNFSPLLLNCVLCICANTIHFIRLEN